ncbi:siderophore ABC transporter substrate-binding protein [Empedobacter falsenii]|uniref:siderophore ABC transporter substrate-binding protein n=1 Tax=Empedobacter falsenii TaxID=343874 RepID=UPI0025781343|nr:siderophore ABC transporter substrate-binding protein [Empedobacter falsenii]MDM1063933.1 siderophore ABC transporter substrate-binding protein [Empedobacter falsenii]MDM1547074.1 siderophore ABC transporter substrate-binding protein [Empedobacter falsenii]
MKKIHIALALAIGIIVTSCGDKKGKNAENATYTIEIVHALDTVSVPIQPKKVVVFDIGAMETLNELGVKPVGVPAEFIPEHLKFLKDDKSITDVGSMMEPNFEKIYAAQPDLIVISARSEKFYKQLSEIAPTIYTQVDNKDYVASFEKNNLMLGKIFGQEEKVQKRINDLKAAINSSKDEISKSDKKALVILYNKGKFSAYGKNSRFGFIHDVMGVKPIDQTLEVATHGQPISNEFIETANPDYLFILDRAAVVNGIKTNKSEIENALIQRTNAYKNNNIIYLDPQVWYLSGGGLTSTEQMINDVKQAVLKK